MNIEVIIIATAGKWSKVNHSGFEDFAKANGPMTSGGDNDDIKMNIEVKPDEMILKWSVGDAPDKSVHFTYDGARENECLGSNSPPRAQLKKVALCPDACPVGRLSSSTLFLAMITSRRSATNFT